MLHAFSSFESDAPEDLANSIRKVEADRAAQRRHRRRDRAGRELCWVAARLLCQCDDRALVDHIVDLRRSL